MDGFAETHQLTNDKVIATCVIHHMYRLVTSPTIPLKFEALAQIGVVGVL